MYPSTNFHFIIGSDLLPWLVNWDEGEKLVEEIGFIVIERGGHEEKMDPNNAQKPFKMPKTFEIIDGKKQ